eukprot:Gregarina_sp_Pseudo_9__2033@NODE_2409_length_1004_cov_16_751295_g2216_i0_p1_GENE_NODE_2409_length_1004_cov_16_751295_g2216_i0NODE_2409_length_1004_cov_16_751295_g2216_i0_p1_ORF_typecomplete_len173_score2_22NT5C/PF06941_12/5_2e05_NODE_2409_length_1004_cov_16_751295_g2216_i0364882
MAKLSKHFRLALVTARNENDRALTETWLRKFIPVPFEFFLYGYTRAEHYRPKGLLCRSINAVCLVDDHCNNIASVVKEQVGIAQGMQEVILLVQSVRKAVLFNYNNSYGWSHVTPAMKSALGNDASKVVIAKDWSEAVDEILQLVEPSLSEYSVSTVAAVSPTAPSDTDPSS